MKDKRGKQKREKNMRKTIIGWGSVCFYAALAICTVITIEGEKRRYPQVVMGKVEKGSVLTDGKEEFYEYTVPVSALAGKEGEYQIYMIFSFQGKLKEEYTVAATGAEVITMDKNRAALESDIPMDIVWEADRELEDGMQVMINERK